MKDFVGKVLTKEFFNNPVFIVGSGRSGTSVLLQALGKHPCMLAMIGEAPFITSMGGASYLFEISDNKEYYLESIRVSKDYLFNYLRRISFEIAAGSNYGLKMMVKRLLRGDLSLLRTSHWVAKTFPSYNVSKGLTRLYPNVKFIYIVRNGLDVVQSMSKFSGFRQRDFDKNCRVWARSVDKYRYLLSFDCAIALRHEQLVANPEELFEKILLFIGVKYHYNPLNFVKNTVVHPLDKPTQTGVDVKKVLHERKASYQSWSPEQREVFRSICDTAMDELGYEIPF